MYINFCHDLTLGTPKMYYRTRTHSKQDYDRYSPYSMQETSQGQSVDLLRKAGVRFYLKHYKHRQRSHGAPQRTSTQARKTGVVCDIKCTDCITAYICKAESNLKKWIAEHYDHSSCPVGHHQHFHHRTWGRRIT